MAGILSRRDLLRILAGALFLLSGIFKFSISRVWAMEFKRNRPTGKEGAMQLPLPRAEGSMSLETAIKNRRSVRSYKPDSITLEQFSNILWAAQGITEDSGFKRAAPSAGALYPMDVYAVVGANGVAGLETGVYIYQAQGHLVLQVQSGDLREAVAHASLSQMWMAGAPMSIVITAEYGRLALKYGRRSARYAMIEAGHIGQNIFLQAGALGLSAGIVGAFHEEELTNVLGLPHSHDPLLVMPVGYKRN